MNIRPQNQYRPATDQLAQDLLATIAQHPLAFDVVVFPADSSTKEDVSAAAMEDVVGSLESHERRLDYGEPFTTLALEANHELERYSMLSSGSGYGIIQSESGVMRMLIQQGPVPKRSVVAYVVDTGAGLALRIMYVMKGDTIGRKAPAGNIYSMIPYLGGLDDLTLPSDEPGLADIIAVIDDVVDGTPPPEVEEFESIT